MLMTSLAQIKSFRPCESGWTTLLASKTDVSYKNLTEIEREKQFPVTDCVESNSISDVCWLLGKLKRTETLAVFARKCADSVKFLVNPYSRQAADAAADADADAAADAAYAAAAAAYAYAYAAADAAAADAADADAAADAARKAQNILNKQFLVEAINEFDITAATIQIKYYDTGWNARVRGELYNRDNSRACRDGWKDCDEAPEVDRKEI